MPFTQISLRKGKPAAYRRALMEEVYLAMRDTISIPEDDRFATIAEFDEDNINNSGNYMGISRTEDTVLIQITLNKGRTTDLKKKLYHRIAERLATNPGVPPNDVVISLIEVSKEDWSLGNGEAQYA